MTCPPKIDLGDDPRTANVSMPVPEATDQVPLSAVGSYNMETDPLHIAYYIENDTPWSQLLAHGWTPKQIVTSGVSLQQIVNTYGWQELRSWGFDASHFASMGADATTFRSIPSSCLYDFRAKDIIKACPTIQELLVTTWSPNIVRKMGFTWKQLKRMGIEKVIHGETLLVWKREFNMVRATNASCSSHYPQNTTSTYVQEQQEQQAKAPTLRRVAHNIPFKL